MKRVSLLILLSMILALAACTTEPSPTGQGDTQADLAAVPGQPTIQLTVADTAYDGLAGAYCWFQAANDIKCEPGPLDPEPSEVISVNQGDTVTFAVGSETVVPSRLTATLLDDLDSAGEPQAIELDSALVADYTIDLDPGRHRISIVAEFSGTESDTNFITTVFAVDVAAALAMEPTTEASATAASTTEEPAETEEPTEEPSEAATEMATETPLPTEVPPTDAPAALPPTSVPPTTAPTSVPPTVAPPTRAPSATPVPRPTTAPTTAAVQLPATAAPDVVVVKGDNRYTPSSVEVCAANGENCTTVSNAEDTAAISLAQGDTVRIDSADGGPTRMTFTVTSTSGTQVFDRVDIPGNPVALYTVSAAPGSYLLKIETIWPSASVTYYFRLQITG